MIVSFEVEIDTTNIVEEVMRDEIKQLMTGKQDESYVDFAVECIKELCDHYTEDWEEYITESIGYDDDIQRRVEQAARQAITNGATLDNIDVIYS